MKTVTLPATFDGQHIQLVEPYPIPPRARMLVTILPESDGDEAEFRQFWSQLATQSFARAYGPGEPDYPDSCIKEPNPLYEGR
jgi:hypothetical protein